jgi:hypothetical protein
VTVTRKPVAWGAAVLVLVLAVGLVLLPQFYVRQKRDVPVPPSSAAPETVVKAYLDSVDAHDCKTTEAVFPGTEESGWCKNAKSLNHVRLYTPPSGYKQDATHAYVGADFHVTWRWLHTDPTMNGKVFWGYFLRRSAADQPWRIVGGGIG